MWRNGRNDDHILTVSRSGLGGEKVVFFCRFGRFGKFTLPVDASGVGEGDGMDAVTPSG